MASDTNQVMASLAHFYEQRSARVRKAARAIVPSVRGQHADDDGIAREHHQFDVERHNLPIPSIARATLLCLGCYDAGRSEKVAWRIPFQLDGNPCFLEDQKFGVNLHAWLPSTSTEGEVAEFGARFLRILKVAMRIAETDIFYPAIKAQVGLGKLGLRNQAGSLRSTYLYFRESARLAFASEGRLQEPAPPVDVGGTPEVFGSEYIRAWTAERVRTQEGSANTVAMVNSFFSYMEHYLVLALPFSTADLARVELTNFMGSTWSEKFKTVINILKLSETKALYDRLVHVAETYRNPLAHGGDDKKGSTLSVFLEQVGRVPLMLSGIEKTPSFRLDPFDDSSFEEVTAIFDQVEDLLNGPLLGNASRWIDGGFDVFFDADEHASYHAQDESFGQFCEKRGREWERQTNMDW